MYPYGFQPATQPSAYQPVTQQPQQLQRVNGIDSARAYPTQPNSTVALFDSNVDLMYIKSTDASNFPIIRTFKFEEVTNAPQKTEQFVTIEEFNKFKEEVLNGKQFVQSKPQSNGSHKGNDEFRKNQQ